MSIYYNQKVKNSQKVAKTTNQQQKYQIFKKCQKWPKIHTFSLLELESPLLSFDDINFLIISCEPLIVSFMGEVVAEADLLDFPPRISDIMSCRQSKIIVYICRYAP